ncbi:MAG: VOC family protein [Bryobacteraceae bacterium]
MTFLDSSATPSIRRAPDGTIVHAELTLNGGMVMLGSQKSDGNARRFKAPAELDGFETSSIYVVVPDADAIYERAQASEAIMIRPIEDMHFGGREFSVKDLEGHTWTLGTYDPWNKHTT